MIAMTAADDVEALAAHTRFERVEVFPGLGEVEIESDLWTGDAIAYMRSHMVYGRGSTVEEAVKDLRRALREWMQW